MTIRRRRLAVLAVGSITVLLVAIPVLGADPSAPASSSPSAATSPSTEPTSGSSPESFAPSTEPSTEVTPSTGSSPSSPSKPADAAPDPADTDTDKTPESDKAAEIPVTATGTVAVSTDGQGRHTYTLTANGKTWDLSDGPPWFWGDKNPLNAYIGTSVTVVGTAEAGGTELEVDTVNGKAIREPGKPPWAGGPWVVGPTHPGWKPWMANGKPGSGAGRNNAPGQTKDKTEDSDTGS